MLVEFGFVVATHGDLSEADADFSATEALYETSGVGTSFDAVTLAKKASGEARFGRRHQQVGAIVDEQPMCWSLAGGLAAALYPSVGVDLGSVSLVDLEILSSVAGTVQRGLGRAGLTAVGDHLDGRPAALITACSADIERTVEEHLGASRPVVVRHMTVDMDAITRLCARAIRSRPSRSDHADR
mgnify:FL=1